MDSNLRSPLRARSISEPPVRHNLPASTGGTEGPNPSPSSGESRANLTSSIRAVHLDHYSFERTRPDSTVIGGALQPDARWRVRADLLLDRERLLSGKWKIRPAAGLYFKREWFAVVDEVPADLDVVRYWDLAATEKTEFNDPDWTVGIKLGRDKNGGYWLLDMVRGRANPGDIDSLLLNTATQDSNRVRIGFGKDPGQAGKSQALHLVRALSGFAVVAAPESGDKLTRFGPFSSQCRAGNVKIRRAPWNEELFRVLEGFPGPTIAPSAASRPNASPAIAMTMISKGAIEKIV